VGPIILLTLQNYSNGEEKWRGSQLICRGEGMVRFLFGHIVLFDPSLEVFYVIHH